MLAGEWDAGKRYNGLHVLPLSFIKGLVASLPSTATSLILLCATACGLPILGITGWQQHDRLRYIPVLASSLTAIKEPLSQAPLDTARVSDIPLSMILPYRRPRGDCFLVNLITEVCPNQKPHGWQSVDTGYVLRTGWTLQSVDAIR